MYALEATFPDALCRQLEDAARTYMLSEVPQDFISELLITQHAARQDRDQIEAAEARVHLTQTRSGRSQ